MKKLLMITLSMFIAFNAAACSGGETETTPPKEEGDEKPEVSNSEILIVYFSRAGENYGVGTVSVGNTAVMAGYIQELTGGATFEIVPAVPYPAGYEDMKTVSQQETATNARPAIKNKLEGLEKYSVVFIGSPIWYGAPPMIMNTFYEAYPELKNKIIVPFGTHEGSGISSCQTLLKRYFPETTIKESLGLTGREVQNSPEQSRNSVRNWIDKLNITK